VGQGEGVIIIPEGIVFWDGVNVFGRFWGEKKIFSFHIEVFLLKWVEYFSSVSLKGRNPVKNFWRSLRTSKLTINTSPKTKMSELICEYASDYINMGENTEERQNYLNEVCTAWNIASLDQKDREGAIQLTIEDYKKRNPGTDDVADFEQNLRKLIQKKLEMFPDINKIIVDAEIQPIDKTKFQVNVASTYDKGLLREMFKKGSDRVIKIRTGNGRS